MEEQLVENNEDEFEIVESEIEDSQSSGQIKYEISILTEPINSHFLKPEISRWCGES